MGSRTAGMSGMSECRIYPGTRVKNHYRGARIGVGFDIIAVLGVTPPARITLPALFFILPISDRNRSEKLAQANARAAKNKSLRARCGGLEARK